MARFTEKEKTLWFSAADAAGSILEKWSKARPDNEELDHLRKAFLGMVYYNNALQMDMDEANLVNGYLREETLKAKAKVEELEEEIRTLNLSAKL